MHPPISEALRAAFRHHGGVRGGDSNPRSTSFEGRFGRMFRTLPAATFAEASLVELAAKMTAPAEAQQTPETEADAEENSGIAAGFTYLGQFIDHDLTFDPASSLERQNDPDALVDFRTPRFDLDSVYGRGPSDQPYLYRGDGLRMLQGEPLTGNADDSRARDLPRNSPAAGEPARALIGDPRNDENVIVSQLQGAFLRFHNRMVDFLTAKYGSPTFEEAQRMVRWHYQWVVLFDFLPTILNRGTYQQILPHVANGTTIAEDPPQVRLYRPKHEAFIPVEFSVAAYRFGHSMVRPIYRLNQSIPRLPIFSASGESLVGFRAFPRNWAIDWRLYFSMGPAPKLGPTRVQPAYKIDSSLVNPLGDLPRSVAFNPSSLAQRNLIRGLRMGLPSGQSVAYRLGITPVPDNKLRVGKATAEDAPGNPKLTDISPAFGGKAPLWYYVLAEAQQQFDGNDETPIRLGPVGGRIVGETFVGLLLEDSHSFLRQCPSWRPFDEFLSANGEFRMADLLKQALQA